MRRRTNAQLLAWQAFNLLKNGSNIFIGICFALLVGNVLTIKSYESLILIGSTLTFFFLSGLGQTVVPYYESIDSDKKESLFRSLFILLTLFGTISSILVAAYGFLFNEDQFQLYAVFAFAVFFNVPSYALENHYLVLKKHTSLLSWGLITYLLQIPLIIVPVVYTGSLLMGIYAWGILALLKFLYVAKRFKLFTNFHIDFNQIKAFLNYSTPVILSFVVGGSFVYVNALIVEYYLSEKEFVLYRYGAREFPLFLIIANSFSVIYSSKIAASFAKNNIEKTLKLFKKKTSQVMAQLFPMAIVLMMVSGFLFEKFYTSTYADAALVFNIQLFLIASRVLFPQTILFGIQKSRQFFFASALELIVGTSLSLLLVGEYGLIGVSISMVIAFMVEKIYLIAVCYKNNISFFSYFPFGKYLIYCAILTGSFFISLQL